jgi:hypothetical protein
MVVMAAEGVTTVTKGATRARSSRLSEVSVLQLIAAIRRTAMCFVACIGNGP